jgi:ABC-type glycerol-3-phosphate transport system permease component
MNRQAERIALKTLLWLVALLWIVPVYFVFIIAIKEPKDFAMNPFWALPSTLGLFQNIKYAWEETNLRQPFFNSLIYSVVSAGIAIWFASMAAFAVSRLKIRGGFAIFLLLWSGTIFPIQTYLIPLYEFFRKTGLYDTKLGMILVYSALAIPFAVFVFRNHFMTIPKEIQEAAALDGCSNARIYWSIIMPNSLGSVAVLALFQGSWIWNDLVFSMVLSKSREVRSVMNSLTILQGVYAGTNLPTVMAATLAVSLPTVLMFMALQPYFIKGLSLQTAGE